MEKESEASKAVLNCIDLSNPNIDQSVYLLKQSCTDSGFFYLVNHGISQDFMDQVFAQSKKFFTLPLNQKMKLLRNENHRGYTPLQDETLDPKNQSQGDSKEGYYIGVEHNAPNIWPASDVLPGWRETTEEFQLRALEVGKAVAKIIALALGLDADFFNKPETLGESLGVMRLLHYQDKISDPSHGLYAAGAHTDYGLITLLATDDVPGLQICKNKYAKPQIWEDVPPLKGAFIVNLGDMLERWSNTTFKSTLHRVIGNGQERYSIAYFLDPGLDCLVECLPTCKSDANPPKFPPIYFRDYLSQRYKDTYPDLLVDTK
ncbi:hypothetical protein P8452_40126 [Trifolium repens]|nr:hypothetical protein P8452_40126 [Trifolium repens]